MLLRMVVRRTPRPVRRKARRSDSSCPVQGAGSICRLPRLGWAKTHPDSAPTQAADILIDGVRELGLQITAFSTRPTSGRVVDDEDLGPRLDLELGALLHPDTAQESEHLPLGILGKRIRRRSLVDDRDLRTST